MYIILRYLFYYLECMSFVWRIRILKQSFSLSRPHTIVNRPIKAITLVISLINIFIMMIYSKNWTQLHLWVLLCFTLQRAEIWVNLLFRSYKVSTSLYHDYHAETEISHVYSQYVTIWIRIYWDNNTLFYINTRRENYGWVEVIFVSWIRK